MTDRDTIAELVHGYALAIRRGDPAAAAALFAGDGSFETREVDPRFPAASRRLSLSEGREAVARYVTSATAAVRILPMIHNLMIEITGEVAGASSLMVGRLWPQGGEVIGEYADRFCREGGQWRFAARVYTIFREQEG